MCDYSLENQISRAAEVGDKLVTSSFPMTPTRGFCAENEAGVAVCLLPGTELAFEGPVRYNGLWGYVVNYVKARMGYNMADASLARSARSIWTIPTPTTTRSNSPMAASSSSRCCMKATGARAAAAGQHDHVHHHEHARATAPRQRSELTPAADADQARPGRGEQGDRTQQD